MEKINIKLKIEGFDIDLDTKEIDLSDVDPMELYKQMKECLSTEEIMNIISSEKSDFDYGLWIDWIDDNFHFDQIIIDLQNSTREKNILEFLLKRKAEREKVEELDLLAEDQDFEEDDEPAQYLDLPAEDQNFKEDDEVGE